MSIKAVVFDVGETLVDESRYWSEWASYFGVPIENFMDRLKDTISRGRHHHDVFRSYDPDFGITEALRARKEIGTDFVLRSSDLYPDAISSLNQLKQHGFKIGIAGNQPEPVERALGKLGIPADYVASSATLHVEKPDSLFFQKIAEMMALDAGEIAYVGDRLDNDIFPAQSVGMKGIFLKRGPWGQAHAQCLECQNADFIVGDLAEVKSVLTKC